MEMTICMLFEKNLPEKFWAKAVNNLVYLVNWLTSYQPIHLILKLLMKCG